MLIEEPCFYKLFKPFLYITVYCVWVVSQIKLWQGAIAEAKKKVTAPASGTLGRLLSALTP